MVEKLFIKALKKKKEGLSAAAFGVNKPNTNIAVII